MRSTFLRKNNPDYRGHRGSITSVMPKLKAANRHAISFHEYVTEVVNAYNSDNERLKEAWMGDDISTSDGILYHQNGNVKFVKDADFIRDLNTSSKIHRGYLMFDSNSQAVYDSYDVQEFKPSDYEDSNFSKGSYTLNDAKENPIFLELLNGDKNLLNEYIDIMGKSSLYDKCDDVSKEIYISLFNHSNLNVAGGIVSTFSLGYPHIWGDRDLKSGYSDKFVISKRDFADINKDLDSLSQKLFDEIKSGKSEMSPDYIKSIISMYK